MKISSRYLDKHNKVGEHCFAIYSAIVLRRPLVTLWLVAIVLGYFAYSAKDFRLDVSSEALVLENDKDLAYYRAITSRYGSDDYLIVTYTPREPLFSSASLAHLRSLRDALAKLERVSSVVSLLDVPLLRSPPVAFADLGTGLRTLESPDVDMALAQRELLTSEFYRNRLMLSLIHI